jgi:hypothetical protein
MSVTPSIIGRSESSGSVPNHSLTVTTVVGKKYLIQAMTEGPAITDLTANSTSIFSALQAAWTTTGTSNPRTSVFLFTAAATSTTFQITAASASKQGLQVVLADDLLAVRAAAAFGAVSGALSASIASAPGDTCLVLMSSWYPLSGITPGTGVSALSGTSGLSNIELWAAQKAGGTGTITMDATFGSGQWSAAILSLQPATTVAAPTNGTRTATVVGDKITISWSVTSAESPSCTASLGGAGTYGPVAATVTGAGSSWTATAEFTGLPNGTYTTSVTSGNSGGTDTDAGPDRTVALIRIIPASFPIDGSTGGGGGGVSAGAPATVSGPSSASFGASVVFTVTDSAGVGVPGVELASTGGTFDDVTDSSGRATMVVGIKTGKFSVWTV